MKSTFIKISAALALLSTSAIAFAATSDCCLSIDCCIQMLACCF